MSCSAPADPYGCEGYRLPTEAEWEGAARCGEDLLYAGSVSADAVAWTAENSFEETHPVGLKAANACGLVDMSGNVWEWTNDVYGSYSDGLQVDPAGPLSGSYRVDRGGSWNHDAAYARVALRNGDSPGYRLHRLGVRLLRTAP